MIIVRRFGAGCVPLLALTLSLAGCFDDPSPRDISVQVTGEADTPVEVIYSKQFEAGVDESGGTHVQVYRADTVFQALPVDTVINVEVEQRLFIQIGVLDDAQVTITAQVYVDGRRVIADSREILPSDPWRYLYVFNQLITPITDVVF